MFVTCSRCGATHVVFEGRASKPKVGAGGGFSVPGSDGGGFSVPGSLGGGSWVPGSDDGGLDVPGSFDGGFCVPGSLDGGFCVPGSLGDGFWVPGSLGCCEPVGGGDEPPALPPPPPPQADTNNVTSPTKPNRWALFMQAPDPILRSIATQNSLPLLTGKSDRNARAQDAPAAIGGRNKDGR
jgi:hypothetical protein